MSYKMSFSVDELVKNVQELSSPEAKEGFSQINFENVKNTFLDVAKHRLFCFEGTTGRREFGLYAIGAVAVYVVYSIVVGIVVPILCRILPSSLVGIICGIVMPLLTFWLVPFCLFAATGARRLHETGKSGWLQLIAIIPAIGWLVVWALYLGKKAEGCCCGCEEKK